MNNSYDQNSITAKTCGTCGGSGRVVATEAAAKGAPIGEALSGPCGVCGGTGVKNSSTRNDWHEAAAADPVVTFISHYAADRLNEQRRADEEVAFQRWIESLSNGE